MSDKVMVLKMPEEMLRTLEKIGKVEERTKAFLIRKAVKKFVEEKEENGSTTD